MLSDLGLREGTPTNSGSHGLFTAWTEPVVKLDDDDSDTVNPVFLAIGKHLDSAPSMSSLSKSILSTPKSPNSCAMPVASIAAGSLDCTSRARKAQASSSGFSIFTCPAARHSALCSTLILGYGAVFRLNKLTFVGSISRATICASG